MITFTLFSVYLDAGTLSTDTAMITFTFDSTITHNRFWDIKVSQIPCRSKAEYVNNKINYYTWFVLQTLILQDSFQHVNYNLSCYYIYSPPDGCLQYHTGVDGRFETFNFPGTTTMQHLQNQDYRVCIRQEEGML